MATNKKLPSTSAIATVAASLYTGDNSLKSDKEAWTSSVYQGNQMFPTTPIRERNIYTWRRESDMTNQNYCSPASLAPNFISRGGFTPPVFGVYNSPYPPCPEGTSQPGLDRFHRPDYPLTPSRPAPGDNATEMLCTCQKSPKVILCKTCGETFTGRVQGLCEVHPKKIFLMDLSCCIKCQSENLKELADA